MVLISLKGLWAAIKKNAVNGTAGARLFPKKDTNDDKKYGIRIDLGEKVSRKEGGKTHFFRNLNLQINRDAENEGLKKAAGKNGTHAKRIMFEVPLNEKGDALHKDLKESDVDAIIDELKSKGV